MSRRDLRMIYRDIPPMSCRAGCTDCCGPVPWSDAELARVAADVPIWAEWIEVAGIRAMRNPLTGKCPFAIGGRCAVYDRRPYMCRLFGTAPSVPRLRCPHGCAPAKPLTAAAAHALTNRYAEPNPESAR